VSNLAKYLLTSYCIRQEAVLDNAGFHVTQSRAMRGMVHYRAQEAIESLIALKRHDTRYRVLVCDYAQNINYPHYGGEQLGDIYFLSALTINLFGIVDLSVTPKKLNCYAYRESTAKKGSNNVASMLMHNFHEKNWLMKGNPGKRITIAMDNCGSQNKNNHVLRLAAYLVEMKFFLEVEFVFYVRGHMKNACDIIFNQMKLRFQMQDIFTYKQALDALGKQDNVTMMGATEGMFNNYGSLLDKYYNNFKTVTIHQNHVFCMNNQDPDLNMKFATHDGANFLLQPMLKRGAKFSDEPRKEIQDYALETLKLPGLLPIKQVKLYKKFRPYVPTKYWAETCPKPTDEVIDSVCKERAKKRTTKKNNDAEKVVAKERKIAEAAEKKEKCAASRTQKKEERQEEAVKRKAISDDKAWEKAILVEERQMEKISRKK
jgi:hypothetical protein